MDSEQPGAAKRARSEAGAASAASKAPLLTFLLSKGGKERSDEAGDASLNLHDLVPAASAGALEYFSLSSTGWSKSTSLLFAGALGEHLKSSSGGGLLIFDHEKAEVVQEIAKALSRKSTGGQAGSECVLFAPFFPNNGTVHAKPILLFFQNWVRVFIPSANMMASSHNYNTENMFWQDFPLKLTAGAAAAAPFGDALLSFFRAMRKTPRTGIEAGDVRRLGKLLALIPLYDYSSAKVTLIPSFPGDFGPGTSPFSQGRPVKNGHLELRHALRGLPSHQLFCSISSIGSLKSFLPEFLKSLKGTNASDEADKRRLTVFWPSLARVRGSPRGEAGGGDFFTDQKELDTAMKPGHDHVSLCEYAPTDTPGGSRPAKLAHAKIFCSAQPPAASGEAVRIDWLFGGSQNLSQAAWGWTDGATYQAPLAYELGVLFTPAVFLAVVRAEAAAVAAGRLPPSRFTVAANATEGVREIRFVAQFEGSGGRGAQVVMDGVLDVQMPVPFKLGEPVAYVLGATDPRHVPWIRPKPEGQGGAAGPA